MLCGVPSITPIIKRLFPISYQSPMAQDSNFGNLPGFGRPLDWNDNAELFPTALNSCLRDADAFHCGHWPIYSVNKL
jgi:hypothetical protein